MLDLLTFVVVAAALGMPMVVPLMWGQTERRDGFALTIALDHSHCRSPLRCAGPNAPWL